MEKKTTEMTITELEKAIPGMGDDDLRAAFAAEKAAGADKERKGAISALEAAAKSRILELTARVGKLDGAAKSGTGGVTREEVLALHRKLEALANHLNFRLPA